MVVVFFGRIGRSVFRREAELAVVVFFEVYVCTIFTRPYTSVIVYVLVQRRVVDFDVIVVVVFVFGASTRGRIVVFTVVSFVIAYFALFAPIRIGTVSAHSTSPLFLAAVLVARRRRRAGRFVRFCVYFNDAIVKAVVVCMRVVVMVVVFGSRSRGGVYSVEEVFNVVAERIERRFEYIPVLAIAVRNPVTTAVVVVVRTCAIYVGI